MPLPLRIAILGILLTGLACWPARAQVAASQPATAPARPQESATRSLVSGGQAIGIEVFLPPQPGTHPAVLLVHGGDGLQHPLALRQQAAALARQGFVAFIPHYFDRTGTVTADAQATRSHFDAWKQTLDDTIGWALQQPEVAPAGVGLVGNSLGAALTLAQTAGDSRVKVAVEGSGGLAARYTKDIAALPPLLVLQGQNDPLTPAQRVQDLQKLWIAHNALIEVHLYPDQGHTLKGEAQADALRRTAEFLQHHLPTPPATQSSQKTENRR